MVATYFYLQVSSTLLIILIQLNNAQLLDQSFSLQENAHLDFIGLANRYGFRPVQYDVTTEDGYILSLFHIPGTSATPVLLVHGILDTSDTWLLRGEGSLGVTLAHAGYDLWFANSRGNRYSRRHVSLDPNDDAAYWDFSFHHMGHYDLPAIIDTVLNQTKATNISAIGHSRGNLIFYVLGATRPEYNSKINVMIALAPICHLRYVQPPVMAILRLVPYIDRLLNSRNMRITEFFGTNSTSTMLLREFCTYPLIGPITCLNNVFFPLLGYDPAELEPSYVGVFIYHVPAGTSWMDIRHFSQQTGRYFAQFDYGAAENLRVYRAPTPPLYNLTAVGMPVALLAGRNDYVSTLPDVATLRRQLPNVASYVVSRRALFNHADDVWGRHMADYLFPDIFRLLKQYN